MPPTDDPDIDWTGVQPDRSRIAPLDAQTFLVRLQLLSERAHSLTVLRRAFVNEPQPDGQQRSRHPESARPQDLLDIGELEQIKQRRENRAVGTPDCQRLLSGFSPP